MRGLPHSYNLHDVAFWVDGFGIPDRKTGKSYTFSNTTSGELSHDGRWIVANETGDITIGNNGEKIKSIVFWLKNSTAYATDLVDLDGANKIIQTAGDITTNITGATVYINGVEGTETVPFTSDFISVVWDTGVTASAVVLAAGLNGKMTNVIAFTKRLSVTDIQELYNKFRIYNEPLSPTGDKLITEDSEFLLLEDEYYILQES